MRLITYFLLKKSNRENAIKHPVHIRCTLNGQRFELSTGIFIDAESWDKNAQRLNPKDENSSLNYS